jgi:hypothetical protein
MQVEKRGGCLFFLFPFHLLWMGLATLEKRDMFMVGEFVGDEGSSTRDDREERLQKHKCRTLTAVNAMQCNASTSTK